MKFITAINPSSDKRLFLNSFVQVSLHGGGGGGGPRPCKWHPTCTRAGGGGADGDASASCDWLLRALGCSGMLLVAGGSSLLLAALACSWLLLLADFGCSAHCFRLRFAKRFGGPSACDGTTLESDGHLGVTSSFPSFLISVSWPGFKYLKPATPKMRWFPKS